MRHTMLIAATFAAAALATPASAQKFIYTGGAQGAYHTLFCPPLPDVLKNKDFAGYSCQTSDGAVDNINKVLANPKALGIVQSDVFARTSQEVKDVGDKLTVLRQLPACEGLWLVTKNTSVNNYGEVSRRATIILPPELSGSAGSFKFLQSVEPDGMGRIPSGNVKHVKDATQVINEVAASDRAYGFFVQFADPSNANVKLINDKGLKVIPVVSREILQSKVGDSQPYQVQEFTLESGYFSGKKLTTACTPAAIVGWKSSALADKNERDNQKDLADALAQVQDSALMPRDSRIAGLIKSATKMSEKGLAELVGAVDAARKKLD